MKLSELLTIVSGGESATVEFKKKISKSAIHDIVAFLNSGGGMIFFGVDDSGKFVGISDKKANGLISNLLQPIIPTPNVKIGLIRVDDKDIYYVDVPTSKHLYSYKNVVYLRVGANNRPLDIYEVLEVAGDMGVISFDLKVSEAKISDLNRRKFSQFLKLRKEKRNLSLPQEPMEETLEKMRYLIKGRLSNGAVFIFGKDCNRFLVNNAVQIVVFKDGEGRKAVDSKIIRGNLDTLIEEIMQYFRAIVPIQSEIEGWIRRDSPLYPTELLREAVTNSFIHRNYFDNTENKIFIYPGRIEILNPGGFLPGVTPQKPVHRSRNVLLCQYLFETGRIEKYGSGIPAIYSEARKHNLNVHYNITNFFTRLIIATRRPDELDEKILKLMAEEGEVNINRLVQQLGCSKSSILRVLRKLQQKGTVLKQGQARATRYKLVK